MAYELISSKLMGPYYGNSLYVWSAVLTSTLGGLALGYFAGGQVSKNKPLKWLRLVLGFSAIFFLAAPYLSATIMEATLSMSVKSGAFISSLLYIFPVLVAFGFVSPILIKLITKNEANVGKNAGTIYTISTLGGIFVSLITGFYLIPEIGLRTSSLLGGVVLLIAFALSLTIKNDYAKDE